MEVATPPPENLLNSEVNSIIAHHHGGLTAGDNLATPQRARRSQRWNNQATSQYESGHASDERKHERDNTGHQPRDRPRALDTRRNGEDQTDDAADEAD